MPVRITIILLASLSAMPAAARPPWLGVEVTRLPAAGFEAGEAGRIEALEHRLRAGLRFGARFDAGLDYRYIRYEYEGLDGRNRDLHRLAFPLGADFDYAGWGARLEVAPGISASSNVFKRPLERWTREEASLRAALSGRRNLHGRWDAIVGLSWDRRFGDQQAYPVLGLAYDNGSTSLQLAFPESRLSLIVARGVELTANVAPSGHRWHVVSDETGARFDYRVRAWRGQLGLSLPLLRGWYLDIGSGYETARRHYLTDDRPVRIAANVDGQWLFSAGLRFGRPPGE